MQIRKLKRPIDEALEEFISMIRSVLLVAKDFTLITEEALYYTNVEWPRPYWNRISTLKPQLLKECLANMLDPPE